jgi:hypothetical protein
MLSREMTERGASFRSVGFIGTPLIRLRKFKHSYCKGEALSWTPGVSSDTIQGNLRCNMELGTGSTAWSTAYCSWRDTANKRSGRKSFQVIHPTDLSSCTMNVGALEDTTFALARIGKVSRGWKFPSRDFSLQ